MKDYCNGYGTCKAGNPKSCAAKVCNTVSCQASTGNCVYKPINKGTSCLDGNKCTYGEKCDGAGKCVGGKTITCTPKTCYKGECNASTGHCVYTVTKGVKCDDNNKCTDNDVCRTNGYCRGAKKVCADKYSCTDDYCSSKTGECVFQPNHKACPTTSNCKSYCYPAGSKLETGCVYSKGCGPSFGGG